MELASQVRRTIVMARLRARWAATIARFAGDPATRRAALVAIGASSMAIVVAAAWWIARPLASGGDAADVGSGPGQAAHAGPGLESELGRTIAGLEGVRTARVHVALPEPAPAGAVEERRPTASVVLGLAAGVGESSAPVDGVVRLVAASVPGLDPARVTVLDETGRLLTGGPHGAESLGEGELGIDYQRRVERTTEERIEGLLATMLGAGKAVARVAATIDFSRTERTEELVDPDRTAVRKSQATREATSNGARPVAAAPRAGDGTPRSERRDESQEFEVSRTTSRTVAPMGAVKQLSVAVVVDGTYRDEGGTPVFVPRSEAEVETLRTLVASAVGLSDARGDRLEITSAPFRGGPTEQETSLVATAPAWAPALLARLFAGVLVASALAFVIRPIVALLGAPRGAPVRPGIVVVDGATDAGELARENATLVQQHPERAAQLVRQWLVEGQERAG